MNGNSKQGSGDILYFIAPSKEKLFVKIRDYHSSPDEQKEKRFFRKRGAKIYVDIRSENQGKAQNDLTIWNSSTLTREFASNLPCQYFWTFVENNIEKDLFSTNTSMLNAYYGTLEKDHVPIPKEGETLELIELLWNAKDRAVSWHKSLLTYQEFFEEIRLDCLSDEYVSLIMEGYLTSLQSLHENSIMPLHDAVLEILKGYPGIFDVFCKQTRGRSHWSTFKAYKPHFLPGYIKSDIMKGDIEDVAEFLADCSRTLRIWAHMMESVIDDLLGVTLYNDWERVSNNSGDDYGYYRERKRWSNMPNMSRVGFN